MNEHERTQIFSPMFAAMLGICSLGMSEQPQRRRAYSPPLTPDQRRKVDKKNRRREISKAGIQICVQSCQSFAGTVFGNVRILLDDSTGNHLQRQMTPA